MKWQLVFLHYVQSKTNRRSHEIQQKLGIKGVFVAARLHSLSWVDPVCNSINNNNNNTMKAFAVVLLSCLAVASAQVNISLGYASQAPA
jgi:hypothetical protein